MTGTTGVNGVGMSGLAVNGVGVNGAGVNGAARALPDRAEVVSMLAAFGQRAAEAVPEELGSLELTWLIAEFEQRYGFQLDLDDEGFAAVRTVEDATELLRATVLAERAGARP